MSWWEGHYWEEKSVYRCDEVRRSRGDVGIIESIWYSGIPIGVMGTSIKCIRYKMPATITTQQQLLCTTATADAMVDPILEHATTYDFPQWQSGAYAALADWTGLCIDLQHMVVQHYLLGLNTKPLIIRSPFCTMLPDCECCEIVLKDEHDRSQRLREHLRLIFD